MRAASEVATDEERDPAQSNRNSDNAHGTQRRMVTEGVRRQRTEQRHARHEEAGEARRQSLLGVGQQQPRRAHLDRGEQKHWSPVTQRRSQRVGARGEDQQHRSGDGRPAEHDDRGLYVLHRDLDEQVRNSPDDAHRREEQPTSARHRTVHVGQGNGERRPSRRISSIQAVQLGGQPSSKRVQGAVPIAEVTTTRAHDTNSGSMWAGGRAEPACGFTVFGCRCWTRNGKAHGSCRQNCTSASSYRCLLS